MPVAASRQVHAGKRQGDEADGERRESHRPSGSRSSRLLAVDHNIPAASRVP